MEAAKVGDDHVKLPCELEQIPQAVYYEHRKNSPSTHEREHAKLTEEITQARWPPPSRPDMAGLSCSPGSPAARLPFDPRTTRPLPSTRSRCSRAPGRALSRLDQTLSRGPAPSLGRLRLALWRLISSRASERR